MNPLKLALLGLILLALAYGSGYYFSPDKIKTVEKVVIQEKVVKEEHIKTIKIYDPNSGKLVKETDETGTKETNQETTSKDKETEKTKSSKHYAIKGGVVKALNSTTAPTYRIGSEVALPFFNSWLGVESDVSISRPTLGGYLRLEF